MKTITMIKEVTETAFECDLCGEILRSQYSMGLHLKENHSYVKRIDNPTLEKKDSYQEGNTFYWIDTIEMGNRFAEAQSMITSTTNLHWEKPGWYYLQCEYVSTEYLAKQLWHIRHINEITRKKQSDVDKLHQDIIELHKLQPYIPYPQSSGMYSTMIQSIKISKYVNFPVEIDTLNYNIPISGNETESIYAVEGKMWEVK